ncbi:hypothetical protein AN641_02060 [Candidatus Epulonipiscioides gigas]|nr:hypothetical protein AN641_02060 [Epulopiscium sp. SCG-C07WGA-EpuloA2]
MKKFNIIDFVIISCILFVLIIGVTILNRGPIDLFPDKVKIELLAEIAAQDKYILEKIGNDEIYLSVDNINEAQITDVKLEPTQILVFDKNIEAYKMVDSISGKYNAYLTIQMEAIDTDKHFLVGDTQIKVGAPIFIKSKEYNTKAYILEMEVIQ